MDTATKKSRRLPKILACLLAVGICCVVGIGALMASDKAPESNAATPTTGTLMMGQEMSLGGDATANLMTLNGEPAYSVAPGRANPASGDYAIVTPPAVPQQSAMALLKTVMWTSYEAPGFDASYYPDTYFDGTPMTAEKYQIATYIMASDVYGLEWGNATDGTSSEFQTWVNQVRGATLDKVKEQINYVPSNFTLVEIQPAYPQARVLSFVGGGYAKIETQSASTVITDGNPMYSLENNVWRIYDNQACTGSVLGELVSNGNGMTNMVYLNEGTYYAKQTSASAGYALSDEIIIIEIAGGVTNTVSTTSTPLVDEDPLVILKRDLAHKTTDRADIPQGGATFANAQYTVKYFDETLTTVAAAEAATPVWTKTLIVNWDETKATAAPTITDLYSNGTVSGWALGTYLVEETQAPQAGYFLDASDPYLFSISKDTTTTAQSKVVVGETTGNRSAAISADNALISAERVFTGDISILRYTNGDGTTGQVPAVGATYEIINENDYPVMNPETSAWAAKGETVCTLTTDNNGYASTKTLGNNVQGNTGHLAYGTYTIKEFANTLPEGVETVGSLTTSIMLNGQNRFFTLDETQGAFLRVNKVDKSQNDAGTKSLIPGTTQFRILAGETVTVAGRTFNAGETIAFNDEYPVTNKLTTLTTDADGRLVLPTKLPAASYSLEEVAAPYGYQRATAPIPFTVTSAQATTASYANPVDVYLPDENTWGQISIINKDPDHNQTIVNATATYEIRAAEDIYTTDGTKRVSTGDIVDTVTTTNGKATTKNLYLGSYIVKQTAAPEGYLIDETEYPVTITYVNDTTSPVVKEMTLFNNAVKGTIDAHKVDATSNKTVPVAGTVFEIRAAENIVTPDNYNWYVKGDVVDTVITSDDGIAYGTKKLPLGNYEIVEYTAPYPYVLNTTPTACALTYVDDKTSPVKGDDSVADERSTTVFRAYKNDAETHKLVTTPNTKIGVYAAEDIVMPEGSTVYTKDELVDTITTDATGYGTGTVKAVVGNYYMKEISAPSGYVLNEEKFPVAFVYPGQTAVDNVTDGYIEDVPAKGQFVFTKKDASSGKTIPVAGIVAEIYANEDIVTGDGEVRAKKDELVDTITTGNDGVATSKELYLGSYRIVETQAPEGYLINETPVNETLVYQGQTVPVYSAPTSIEDENVMGVIEVTKIDKETGNTIPVAGTTFEIYAKGDITTPDGTVRASDGTLMDTITTDATGKAQSKELWLGTYTVKETKAPKGYVLSTDEIDAQLVWKDQHTSVVSASEKYANTVQKGIITVEKLDSESSKTVKLSGATYDIVAAEDIVTPDGTKRADAGAVVDTITSDETGVAHTKALYLGAYTVKETKAPEGYLITDKTDSVTLSYGEPTEPLVYEDASISDDVVKGTVSLDVFDSREKDVQLANTKWNIIAAEDITTADGVVHVAKGELAGSVITSAEGKVVSNELYLGKYVLVQEKQLQGYQMDGEQHPFELVYADEKTPVVNTDVTLYNTPTDMEIVKVSDDARLLTNTQFVAWMDDDAANFSGIAVYSPYKILSAEVTRTSDMGNMSADIEETTSLAANAELSATYNVFASAGVPEKGNYKLHVEYTGADGKDYSLDEKFCVNEFDENAIFFIGDLGNDSNMTNRFADVNEGAGDVADKGEGSGADADADKDAADGKGEAADEGAKIAPLANEAADDNATADDDADKDNAGSGDDEGTEDGDENGDEGDDDGKEDADKPNRSELLTAPAGIVHRVPVVLTSHGFAVSAADENGVVEFRYIPSGKASFAESRALDGFASDRRINTITVSGNGLIEDDKGLAGNVRVTDEGKVEVVNSTIKLTVSKTASETGTELPGNTLSVLAVAEDGTETLVDSWLTGNEPHVIEGITAGDYVLREDLAADGYTQAEPVKFRVNDSADMQYVSMENTMIPVVENVIGSLGIAFPLMALGVAMIAAGIFGYRRWRVSKSM